MKKLDAKRYEYEKDFTVEVDQDKRTCTIVGHDTHGKLILERYQEFNRGSAPFSVSEFYEITPDELNEYAGVAQRNGYFNPNDSTRRQAGS